MKWAVRTLGDDVVMMKHIFHWMESSPPVINTPVPYALDFVPPKVWSPEQSRDFVYQKFLWERHYGRDLPHFYTEATLRCIDRQPDQPDPRIDSVHARMVSSMAHEVPGNQLTGLPRG
jgi:hypothetical protein